MYLLIFLVGVIGFVAMAAMGAVHGHGHHGHADAHTHGFQSDGSAAHAHAGHAHGAHAHGAHGHHGHGHGHGHGHAHGHQAHHHDFGDRAMSAAWFLLSPLNIFTICMGLGGTGLLIQKMLPSTWVLILSIVAGFAFNLAFVQPIMNFFLKFETKPSEGLEGMVAQQGEAVTGFDAAGQGVIKLCLDGQIIQILANLEQSELSNGVRVLKGDPVVIVDVDPVRNTCRVTRELTA